MGFVTESRTVYTLWGLARGTTLPLEEFRILDANSEHLGVSVETLLENAGRALAEAIQSQFPEGRILILCGGGNNGGDGLVAARHLAATRETRVVLLAEPKTRAAQRALESLDTHRVPVERRAQPSRIRELVSGADVVVDAILGSGVNGPLREPVRGIVKLLNSARRPTVAVDVPTGLGGPVSVRGSLTVTFHDRKPGMTSATCGRILVKDIGIPAEAATHVGPGDFSAAYPRNAPDSHKGMNGRVLVVAGGPFPGAAILASRAAMRAGVDLVRLLAPRETVRAALSNQPDLIARSTSEEDRLVEEDATLAKTWMGRSDVLLLGPGLGSDPGTRDATERILEHAARSKIRTVLDADALVVAGKRPDLTRRLRPLATPHAGEFKEFTGRTAPKDLRARGRVASTQAKRLRSTILLKGPVDIVTDGQRVKQNRIHSPAMTVGGTGDVLAGLCAGFLAKGMEPFRAACAAAFVNGDAGQRVAARQGGSLVASDLVTELPRVFHAWLPTDSP